MCTTLLSGKNENNIIQSCEHERLGRKQTGTKGSRFQIELFAVAALSEAWFFGDSLAGIVGSNPTVGMGVCLL